MHTPALRLILGDGDLEFCEAATIASLRLALTREASSRRALMFLHLGHETQTAGVVAEELARHAVNNV